MLYYDKQCSQPNGLISQQIQFKRENNLDGVFRLFKIHSGNECRFITYKYG